MVAVIDLPYSHLITDDIRINDYRIPCGDLNVGGAFVEPLAKDVGRNSQQRRLTVSRVVRQTQSERALWTGSVDNDIRISINPDGKR